MRSILTIIFTVMFVASVGTAADSKTSIKTSSKDKATESKRKKGSKDQQEALSQGYSASEALLMGDVRWNFVATQFFTRGFDEFNDAYYSSTALNVSYRINNWSALSLSTSYDAIAYKDEGQLFKNTVTNGEEQFGRDGFNDTDIGFLIPNIFKTKKSSLNYSASVTLPTSRLSQRATLAVGTFNGLTYRYRPMAGLLLFANAGVSANVHRKETADVFGTLRNSPYGFSYSAGLSYNILKTLIASTSYGQFQRVTYDNFVDNIQTFRLSVNYIATAQMSVFAGYRFRDTVITNDQLFDDDRSIAFLGGTYAF